MWSGQLFCSCLVLTAIYLYHSSLDVHVNHSCLGTFEEYHMYLVWWAWSGWKGRRTGSLRLFMCYTNRVYYLTDLLLKLGVTQAHTNLWPSNINDRSQRDRGISVGPCLGAFSKHLGLFSAPIWARINQACQERGLYYESLLRPITHSAASYTFQLLITERQTEPNRLVW